MLTQSFISTVVAGVFFTMGGLLLGLAVYRKSSILAAAAASNFSIAYITGPSEEFVKGLAKEMVTSKLAACVNIIPKVLSIYQWDNKLNEDQEVLMMVKTRTSKIPDLIDFVKARHSYEICEVITVPITHGNHEYLEWISKMVPPDAEHDEEL